MYLIERGCNVSVGYKYLKKNTYPSLTERILSHDPADLLISAITVFELEYGAERQGRNWKCSCRPSLYCPLPPVMQLWRGEAVDIWDARGLRLGHMMSKSQPKDCHRASPWSPTIWMRPTGCPSFSLRTGQDGLSKQIHVNCTAFRTV